MKIAFGMIILNGDFVLHQCLEAVYPFAYQILIAEGPVEYWQKQGLITSTDRTNEILRSFPDPEKKIVVVHSTYSEKDEQCNSYMQFLKPDTDYIWNLDSDEIYKPEDIRLIMDLLHKERYTSVGFRAFSFFGGFDYCLGGFEERYEIQRIRKVYPGSYWKTHRPPTIAHAPGVKVWPEKHLSYDTLAAQGVRMYHYSYVFPRQVKTKIGYYKSAVSKQYCIDDYYNRIWLPWVTGDAETRQKIEKEFNGVHEFIVSYRGDCRPYIFTGKHPEPIQRDLEQLKTEFNRQLAIDTTKEGTCWHHAAELIPAMTARQKEWGKLSQNPHGKVLKGLLEMTEQLVDKPVGLIADIGCGVCPLLDLVEPSRYVGIDLPVNIGEIQKVVGPGIRLVGANTMTDDLMVLADADIVVANSLLDVLERPVECLRRILKVTKGSFILHRQLVHDGPTSAQRTYSYLGPNTSFKSIINRKELYDVAHEMGFEVAIEVFSFGAKSGEDSRSFVLVRCDASKAVYQPRTWSRPEDAGNARTESLTRIAPRLFEQQSVLYIGADRVRFDYGKDFIKANCQLTILEAWEENVKAFTGASGISALVQGDVSETSFPDKSFDVVFWWHGPEHLTAGKLVNTIRRLEKTAKRMVVLGCPWGSVFQGELGGNPFEEHASYLNAAFFIQLGYTVECIGNRDELGSNITAVKLL